VHWQTFEFLIDFAHTSHILRALFKHHPKNKPTKSGNYSQNRRFLTLTHIFFAVQKPSKSFGQPMEFLLQKMKRENGNGWKRRGWAENQSIAYF